MITAHTTPGHAEFQVIYWEEISLETLRHFCIVTLTCKHVMLFIHL